MNSELLFKPLRHLAALVESKQVSPVELTKIALARLDQLGPRYNAIVTITHDRAIAAAEKAQEEIRKGAYRGILHGIPYGVKDIFATAGGAPTTWGARPLKDQKFDYDAAVIQRLKQAGAILTAKLSMVELAGGAGYSHPKASLTGAGISPWGTNSWSGGSSSGSGSAVSAGMVPFAIGTETWGSILCPASYCGVSGLRPTFGRVSRYGCMPGVWSLDKVGPLGQTADDLGIILETISGHDPRDDSTNQGPFRYHRNVAKQPFKLGLLRGSTDHADAWVRANLEKAVDELEQADIAQIEEITMPDMPYEAVATTIILAETSAAFEEFTETGQGVDLTDQSSRERLYMRHAVLASDYIRAMRIRRKMSQVVNEVLLNYDAVIGPSYPTLALPIDRRFSSAFSGNKNQRDIIGSLGNLAGLPSISVPNGFGEPKLPTGIQFMGRPYSENQILGIARAYQEITDWHLKRPPNTSIG